MGVSYEEAVQAQKAYEDVLLQDTNVLSIGVVAESDDLGTKTGDYIVQIGVASIEAYNQSLKHGTSVIPNELLITSQAQGTTRHIRINVVKQGKIEALSKTVTTHDIPDATDKLDSKENITHSNVLRKRPVPCGYSVGHFSITSGTIGLLLEYDKGPNAGKAYILSNNHVLAAENRGYIGDAIIQPGPNDYGIVGHDTIALLHRWVPLSTSTNAVDAAMAEVCDEAYWDKFATSYVSKIGYPAQIIDPVIGMDVVKPSRTTEFTQGEITSINMTLRVKYNMGDLLFKNQIQTTNMSRPGDSGSSLFAKGTLNPIGLLFAGSASASFFNPLRTVLSLLSSEHEQKYPAGKSVVFKRDHTLKIISRNYSTTTPSAFFQPKNLATKTLRNKMGVIGVGIGFIFSKATSLFSEKSLSALNDKTISNQRGQFNK